MNYVLLRNGYPPVIIKSVDKKNYLFALNKADIGDENAFVEYIARELIWSLQINVKAAKGESVEEMEDVDREIAVWKKEIKNKSTNDPAKSFDIIKNLYEGFINDLFELFILKHLQFDELFVVNQITLGCNGNAFVIKNGSEIKNLFARILKDYKNDPLSTDDECSVSCYHRHLIVNPEKDIHITSVLKVVLHPLYYEIFFNKKLLSKRAYSSILNELEQKNIVNNTISEVFELIKKQSIKENS